VTRTLALAGLAAAAVLMTACGGRAPGDPDQSADPVTPTGHPRVSTARADDSPATALPPAHTRRLFRLDSGYSVGLGHTAGQPCGVFADRRGRALMWHCYQPSDIPTGRAINVYDRCTANHGIRTVFGMVPHTVSSVRLVRDGAAPISVTPLHQVFALKTRIGPGIAPLRALVWITPTGRPERTQPLPPGLPPGCPELFAQVTGASRPTPDRGRGTA
jgi:hypothetical protein